MNLIKGPPHWAVYTVCGPRNRWQRNQKLTLSGSLTYRRTRGDAGWPEPSSWSHRERKTTICKLGELVVLKTPWEAGTKRRNTLTWFLGLSSNLSWLVPKGQSYLPEKCSPLLPAAEGREGGGSFAQGSGLYSQPALCCLIWSTVF